MRAADAIGNVLLRAAEASTPAPTNAVLDAIGSVNAIAQTLTRLPLNEALRECTKLLARYVELSPGEQYQKRAEIDVVRRHCRVLGALTRCARELERIP